LLLALNSKAIPIYDENTGEVKLIFVGQNFFPFTVGCLHLKSGNSDLIM